MAIQSVIKGLSGAEDVAWDLDGSGGVFSKRTSKGSTRDSQLVGARHIPVSTVVRLKSFADQLTASSKGTLDVDAVLAQLMEHAALTGIPDTTNDFDISSSGVLSLKQINANRVSIFPETFGAKRNDTTFDSGPAINAAIQSLADTGGTVVFNVGTYYTNEQIVMRTGVTLMGSGQGVRIVSALFGSFIRAGDSFPAGTALIGQIVTGALPADDQFNMRLIDIGIKGDKPGGGNVLQGVKWTNMRDCLIENVFLEFFDNQAILFEDSTSTISTIRNVIIFNSVLATGLAADMGSVELNGPFDNWIENLECGTSSGQVDVEAGKRIALHLKGGTSNNFICGGQFELSEVGVKLASGSARNQFCNARADKNTREGWFIGGGLNSFVGCQALNNSAVTDNTYDGFRVTGQRNMFTGCTAIVNAVNAHIYGFHNTDSNVNSNKFRGCISQGHGTAEFEDDNLTFAWEREPYIRKTSAADDATPDCDNVNSLVLVAGASSRTEITDLDNTETGQDIILANAGGNDDQQYIKATGQFARLNKGWTPQNNGAIYVKQINGGLYTEIGRADPYEPKGDFFYFDSEVNSQRVQGTYRLGGVPIDVTCIEFYHKVFNGATSASSLGTISIGVNTDDAGGIITATLVSNGIWQVVGQAYYASALDPRTPSTWTTDTTAERDIELTIAVEDLTSAFRIACWMRWIRHR